MALSSTNNGVNIKSEFLFSDEDFSDDFDDMDKDSLSLGGCDKKEPQLVARRNARERRRVQMVNEGFTLLRRQVPTEPKHKKLSKVKTLRLAINYIMQLQGMVSAHDKDLETRSGMNYSSTAAASLSHKQWTTASIHHQMQQHGANIVTSTASQSHVSAAAQFPAHLLGYHHPSLVSEADYWAAAESVQQPQHYL